MVTQKLFLKLAHFKWNDPHIWGSLPIDLNLWPLYCQLNAVPTELIGHTVVLMWVDSPGVTTISVSFFGVSVHFNRHFPGGSGLACTRMSPFWIHLELRMMEMVVDHNWSYETCKAPVKISPKQINTQFIWHLPQLVFFQNSEQSDKNAAVVSGQWRIRLLCSQLLMPEMTP